ncbi:peptide chain release factor N(5)-glutamine methyltransferase [Tardiphaga sp.]|uniref:peptide chain release factor N(5)-glutamine methyltransferase n=1 Tax=Tardiphaga sp. TaxID=1926292 RepID=UPI0026356368|nr:peptide chain release factor N(5)-glutamine methyltransferase [Tardiphaga sp.]MDB5617196.1 [protein release factor]-glutamine N5-methyltransferase [Tardiphaga sp.]
MRNPFTGQNVETARRLLGAQLLTHDIDSPDLDARLLVGAMLGLELTGLMMAAKRIITSDEATRLQALADRRIQGEPIARILGVKEFWGLSLALSADTLVPRPDTETIVEAVLEAIDADQRRRDPLRIADLGTGSGAILLALLSELWNATGTGTDINVAALQTARHNAIKLGFAPRALFVACDYACALQPGLDLIVSNPPYIRSAEIAGLATEVRDHDPLRALDGGADGLDAYRIIAPQAAALLAPGGLLVVEVGHDQSDDVASLMQAAGLQPTGPAKADLSGVRRAVLARKSLR